MTTPPSTLSLIILELLQQQLLLGVMAAFLFLSLPSVINLAILSYKAEILCQASLDSIFYFNGQFLYDFLLGKDLYSLSDLN